MSVIYSNNFDSLVAGAAVTGWANIQGTWTVTTTRPISGANAFSDGASPADGDMTLYTAMTSVADMSMQYDFTYIQPSGTQLTSFGACLRMSTDGQNGYVAVINQASQVVLYRRVGGAYTQFSTVSTPSALVSGTAYSFKMEVSGSTLQWRIWQAGTAEPGTWGASVTDTNITAAGVAGVRTGWIAGGTASSVDNLFIGTPGTTFGKALAAAPTSITVNSTGNSITLTGTGTSWTAGSPGSPTFVLQGGTGASITSQSVASATSATVVVNAGTATGSITLLDPTTGSTAIISVNAAVALSIGAITVTAISPTSVSLAVGPASGGTSPYTYAWAYSATGAFSFASGTAFGTNSTSATLSGIAAAGVYIKCRVTDNVAATSVATQIFIQLPLASYVIGFVGDSITMEKPTEVTWAAGTAVPTNGPQALGDMVARRIAGLHGYRAVTPSNQGVSGSRTSDWTSTAGSNYTNAKSAFQSAGVTHISIMLGTNDCTSQNNVSQATYQSNLATICANFLADFPSARIILHAPPYPGIASWSGSTWTETSQALAQAYQTAIAAVVAANPGKVYQGDTTVFGYVSELLATAGQSEWNTDLIHPLRLGLESLAGMQAESFFTSVVGLPAIRRVPLTGGID